MDFMSDTLANGRSIRTFNVIDDYNRESLTIEVDFSLPSARVIRALEQVIKWRGKPLVIRCDNGPEYISQQLVNWANKYQILCYTFNMANQHKMLILSDLIEQLDMNGWICIYFNQFSMHNCWQLNGFGPIIMYDRIHLLEVYLQG